MSSASSDDEAGLGTPSTHFNSPWNNTNHLNDILPNSSHVARERLDASTLAVPALPSFDSMQPMSVRASTLQAIGNTPAPGAKRKRSKKKSKANKSEVADVSAVKDSVVRESVVTSTSQASAAAVKRRAATKKREKKPLPACLKDVKISERERFLHRPEDSDVAGEVVEVCFAIVTNAETVDLKSLNLEQLRRLV